MTFSIDMPCGLVSTQNNKEENTIRFTYNMLSIWADLLGLQFKTNLWERNVMFFSGAWIFPFSYFTCCFKVSLIHSYSPMMCIGTWRSGITPS